MKTDKMLYKVVVGKPTAEHTFPTDPFIIGQIGETLMGMDSLSLAEARKEAKRMSEGNRFWNYHCKRQLP